MKDDFNKVDFVRRDLKTESIIKIEDEKKSKSYLSSVFDPSIITECPRRIVYRTRGDKQNCSPESSIVKNNDIKVKERWIEFFTKCPKTKVNGQDIIVTNCELNLSGKIDVVLEINDDIYVAKIKQVCHTDFSRLEEKGAFKKHVIEVMVYMRLSSVNHGLLLYENKDNHRYIVFNVSEYYPIIKSIEKKCFNMVQYQVRGNLPDRPYENEDARECKICEFSTICYNKKH